MTAYSQLQTRLQANAHTWLITGVAGFIGSNLLETLLKLNQRVVGLDNFATGHQRNLDEVRTLVTPEQWANFQFIQGDIRNLPDCHRAMKYCHCGLDPQSMPPDSIPVDYILHQAALGSVPRSVADPIATHATNVTNVTGFLNMLVAARDAKVKRFVYAASSSTYGDHPALPKWIASLIQGEPVYINGDGETSRDFCFIANVVQANLLAATVSDTATAPPDAVFAGGDPQPMTSALSPVNQIYNVAVGDRTTLNELFAQIRANLLPRYAHLQARQPVCRDFRAADVRHSLADISKVTSRLGYSPTQRIGQGLTLAMPLYVAQENTSNQAPAHVI